MRRMTAPSIALVLSALLSAPGRPALAQVYPPDPKPIKLSSSVASPGETVTISGEQAPPSAEVIVQFFPGPVDLARTTATPDGAWSTQIVIPLEAEPGEHILSAGSGGEVLATIPIEVRAGPAAQAAQPASWRGRLLLLLAAGSVLVAVGFVVLAIRRNRERDLDHRQPL
jgi:hypothetical protein